MTIIDEEKKAIPTLSDKREDHLGLNLTIPHEYADDYSTPLLNAFKNNKIPSREEIKELLKTYGPFEFDFDYLEQYWQLEIYIYIYIKIIIIALLGMEQDRNMEYIVSMLEGIIDKNFHAFEKSYTGNMYKLKNSIFYKHFVINAMFELNDKLQKENKDYRVYFDNDTEEFFFNMDMQFLRES